MKFKIDHKIFEKFSGLTIGVVICKNLNNSGTQEEVQKEIRTQENNIRGKYNIETLSQIPKIDVWRKTYSAFGAKPKENKSSVENLYRLVLQGVNFIISSLLKTWFLWVVKTLIKFREMLF